jgi:hypothetical protein
MTVGLYAQVTEAEKISSACESSRKNLELNREESARELVGPRIYETDLP